MGGGTTNFTSINLAGTIQKKVQSTDDILKQIESTISGNNQEDKFKQEELSQRILGRISQHEAAFGDKNLPRQRLPKMDPMLLDRYNAARRNVLVLGAIKQANASRPSTHRSGKSSTVKDHSDGLSSIGHELSTAREDREQGLNSTFTSFNGSRNGSPDRMARDGDFTAEPSGLLGAEDSHMSLSSRRIRHQGSGRSAASSFAGSGAASSTNGGRLRHVNSSLSTGSGHTMRSDATNFSKYSHFRKTPRKAKSAKPKPGRVTTALAEYAQKDDWLSKTLLKHYLASVIQARWRGYIVRKRWAEQESRLALVEEEKAKQQADALHQQRIHELHQKLVARHAKQQTQATAAAVAATVDGQEDSSRGSSNAAATAMATTAAPGGMARTALGMPYSGTSKMMGSTVASAGVRVPGSRVMSAATWAKGKREVVKAGAREPALAQGCTDSDSDSGWSDIELEDVASIKFRAVTPPWQKVEERCCMSQRLKQRTAASTAAATGQALPEGWSSGEEFLGFGPAWDSSNEECGTRLQELRHRRICRKPELVQLSQPAVAAAAASGLLRSAADAALGSNVQDAVDASEGIVPGQVVEALLLSRYNVEYARMGVPERMPGRQRWKKMQQDQKAGLYSFGATTFAAAVAAQSVLPVKTTAAGAAVAHAGTMTAVPSVARAAAAAASEAGSSSDAAAAVVTVSPPPVAAAPDRPYAVKKPTGVAGGAAPANLPPVKGAA